MSKLRRHLSFANVASCLALFIALGGASYAAVKLPKNSVGARQLKPKSVKAGKIAKKAIVTNRLRNDAVTGAKVRESTLGTVPSASIAADAGHAASADTAANAIDAVNAQNAGRSFVFDGPATDPAPKVGEPGKHTLLSLGALALAASCSDGGGGKAKVSVTLETAVAARFNSYFITYVNPGYEPTASGSTPEAGAVRVVVEAVGGNHFANGAFTYRNADEAITVNLHAGAETFSIDGCSVEGTAFRAV